MTTTAQPKALIFGVRQPQRPVLCLQRPIFPVLPSYAALETNFCPTLPEK